MGCTASKPDNKDEVIRCKGRCRHMKDSINALHRLDATHSDYIRALSATVSAVSSLVGVEFDKFLEETDSAGQQVSKMLETDRAQSDWSISQLMRKFRNLSSSWNKKPTLAVTNQQGLIDEERSLYRTLELLLDLEKDLYKRVKMQAREGVKIEHEKKLAALQSQEYRGEGEANLDKTKASIKSLQSRIVVASRAVFIFSSSIISQRDTDLVPQLVELCHRSMNMWRSLNEFQEVQNHVQQVGGPVNRSTNGEPTSNFHRQIGDLESALSDWHSSFFHRIKFAREFIHSLHAWSKLPLPVNAEAPHPNPVSSDFFAIWKTIYDSDLDTMACGAIENFIGVVQKISRTQTEQLQKSKEIDKESKEIDKKSKEIEKKSRPDNRGHAQDPFAEEKSKLAARRTEVENEMSRHTEDEKETRAKALEDIQKGLETVLHTLSNTFYGSMVKALETLCERCNNAGGVPEESGRGDVEANEGGGGESGSNNAGGVPVVSGRGDVCWAVPTLIK